MKKLVDLVDVLGNNDSCVVLKVLPASKEALICLGFFTGNEVMFRLTKGGTQTFTVFYDDNTTFSWYWGRTGSSCVTDDVNNMGRIIRSCIENDLDIPVDGTTAYLKVGLKIQSKEDAKHATHLIKVMGTAEDRVFKSGAFIAIPAAGVKNVISFFETFGYSVQGKILETKAQDDFPVKAFIIAR